MSTQFRTIVREDGGGKIVCEVMGKEPATKGDSVSMGYTSFDNCARPEVQRVIDSSPEPRQGWYWAKVEVNETREWMLPKPTE